LDDVGWIGFSAGDDVQDAELKDALAHLCLCILQLIHGRVLVLCKVLYKTMYYAMQGTKNIQKALNINL
jgi:hypothetical protein